MCFVINKTVYRKKGDKAKTHKCGENSHAYSLLPSCRITLALRSLFFFTRCTHAHFVFILIYAFFVHPRESISPLTRVAAVVHLKIAFKSGTSIFERTRRILIGMDGLFEKIVYFNQLERFNQSMLFHSQWGHFSTRFFIIYAQHKYKAVSIISLNIANREYHSQ